MIKHFFKIGIHYKQGWAVTTRHEKSHYEKKKHKKINAYRKSVYKEPIVKRCLLILDLKAFRSYIKRKELYS